MVQNKMLWINAHYTFSEVEVSVSDLTIINYIHLVYVQLVLYLQVNLINIIFYHVGHHMNVDTSKR